jgi:hypothetical protein
MTLAARDSMPLDIDLYQLIDRINQLARLDQASVAGVFQAALKRAPDAGNPYIRIFTADVDEPSPVHKFEFREPIDRTSAWEGLLILTLKEDRGGRIGEVRRRFGALADVELPRAAAPFGTPTYESYEYKRGRLSFGYLATDMQVTSVIFDRKSR